jgi:hypothetical protein
MDVNDVLVQKDSANANYQHDVKLNPQETDSEDDINEDEGGENNKNYEIPLQETLCQSQRTSKQPA